MLLRVTGETRCRASMTVNRCTSDPPSLKLPYVSKAFASLKSFQKFELQIEQIQIFIKSPAKVQPIFTTKTFALSPVLPHTARHAPAHQDHNGTTTKHTLATLIPKCGSNNVITRPPLHFRRRRQAAAIATTNEKICKYRQMPLTIVKQQLHRNTLCHSIAFPK